MAHIRLISNNFCSLNICSLRDFCKQLENLFGKISNINIIVCDSHKDLEMRVAKKNGNLPDWVVGLVKGNCIYLRNSDAIAKRDMQIEDVCYHELVHIFINNFTTGCPAWLNEGIAQLLSKSEVIDEEIIKVEIKNPYNLTYESGLYFYSRLVVKKLFEVYGKLNVIQHLKKCKNFEKDDIFGQDSVDNLIKKMKGDFLMKESKYNILLNHKGKRLAFNSITSSFAEVNDDFFRILKALPELEKESLSPEDAKLVEDMKLGGFILDDEDDELNIVKLRSNIGKFNQKGFSLTIAPTLQCNFACPYCYEERQSEIMNDEIKNAIIKRVETEAELKNNIHISWYGGEPLIAKNIIEEMSKKMIAIAEEYGVDYRSNIVTNGYLIDDSTVEILKKAKVTGAQITLDGPPEIHNSRRKLHSGAGTFDRIIAGIKLLISSEISVHIRVNLDKTNVNELENLLKILVDNGLQECSVSLGHVKNYTKACNGIAHNCLNNQEYAEKTLNHQKILLKYGFKADDYPFYPGVKANYCCADTLSAYVVGPNGDLYKCWNDVGNKERVVGNIKEPIKKYNKIYSDYLLWSPFNHEECINCNILPLCMGGCVYNGLERGKPECEKWIYNLDDILKVRYDIFYKENTDNE